MASPRGAERQVIFDQGEARTDVDIEDDDEAEAVALLSGSSGSRAEPPAEVQEVDHREMRRLATKAPPAGPSDSDAEIDLSVESLRTDADAMSQARLPRRSGWLFKARPGWISPWQLRWFVLDRMQLRWYLDPGDLVPLGVLDFDLVRCELERLFEPPVCKEAPKSRDARAASRLQSKSTRSCCGCTMSAFMGPPEGSAVFRVCLSGSSRAFVLCAPDALVANDWVEDLGRHLLVAAEVIAKSPRGSPSAFGRRAWWKVDRISPERFQEVAETGDILLFRSKGTMPRIIRAASVGRYDHVGLIIRMSNRRLALLEATGGNGVAMLAWEDFLQNDWQLLYPELALRRVSFARTKERLCELEAWAKSVIGKPYNLSLEKLRRLDSMSAGGAESDGTFFCSELVAEGLKVLKVLPRGKASAQFWPSAFSAEHRPPIELAEDAAFGQQLTIDFDLADRYEGGSGQLETRERDATTNWFRGF